MRLLHVNDISDLKNRGIPSVFIASSEFKQAAAAQSKALGFNAPVYFVSHPIKDRTDAEMQALANEALDRLLDLICAR